MKTFLITGVVSLIVIVFLLKMVRKLLYNKLIALLQDGEFETFYKKTDTVLYRLLISKIDLLFLKLKASFLEQNKKRILLYLNEIEPLLITNMQKEKVYIDAFNYFISIEDKNNSKKYLNKINELDNPRMKIEVNRVYNIYIRKSDEDLKNLLEECMELEEENRAVHEYLISIIYKNKNDRKNQQKYEDLSRLHMNQSKGDV
ncbi:MAG: hypothetical protein HUJ53_07560 [Holdemanella sp.]|nr:hypothetical protein [Holdemanella sp.]